jgi:branched-chain amino acid transport system ATP-binding protein
MTLLTVDRLASGYQQIPILRDVSFTLQRGESLGILGHNGMGKSTLLKTIAGELPMTAGSLTFGDVAITRMAQHKRALLGLGYVPQGRRIFPNLTVRQNLEMGALGARQDTAIVDTALADFPRLMSILDRRGGVLSGGEQQILALARCLCGKPQLLLLDEPTEGIQPSIRGEIADTLNALQAKHGLTILLVEQNVEFINRVSDRVLHMEKGTLKYELSAQALG